VSPQPVLSPNVKRALAAINPNELKGDLSFIASDTLQGRFTPSPGLDAAAEFIASKFRAAGLKPGGDKDYFQTATLIERHLGTVDSVTLRDGSKEAVVGPGDMALFEASVAVRVDHAPALIFPRRDLDALKKADLAGKAVVVQQPDFAKLSQTEAVSTYHAMRAFDDAVAASHAALELVVTSSKPEPVPNKLLLGQDAAWRAVPIIRADSPELKAWLKQPEGGDSRSVTVDIPGPGDHKVVAKNVIGILPGSDPKLKDTCVMLTAHYDHIGTRETGHGMASPPKPQDKNDNIYNGANDDGSGTVSVIEIARALATLNPRPKRSVVFMTFFGEERGEFGSRYYGRHPVFPIAKTVADINLEQVGRTDSTNGRQINTASLTGYDYSEVTGYLERAGKLIGVKVYKDPEASDAYFTRSDNDALAQQGVPAHSLTVAFDYPDYHGLGDEWQKIDYDNMARVDRMIALGLINMANNQRAPAWNAANPKTAPFIKAQEKSRSTPDAGEHPAP
jgi:Zn-dependent M28 family amino/carboxypeptidase